MEIAALHGRSLGEHTARFTMRDALLYNLMAGAPAEQLELSYERDAGVLPTYACALATWAIEACGALGAYDRMRSLHAGQFLEVRGTLAPGAVDMTAAVEAVWDKGTGAVVVIAVEAAAFVARSTIFVPGAGGWGGERGPSSSPVEQGEPTWSDAFDVPANWAALYRLTGDEHPVHIDPEASAAMGLDRPILHGLCTLAITCRAAAVAVAASPLDLAALDVRFTSPVYPGQRLDLSGRAGPAGGVTIVAAADGQSALAGTLRYAT